MANVGAPTACAECGRLLPPQHGKGRRRRYCDATCRSAARRRRGAPAARADGSVKASLTAAERHVSLDAGAGRPGGAGPVASRVRESAAQLADELGRRGPGSPLAAMVAARELLAATGDALQQAVDQARAAGHSWREIGEVLGTTRQAAFQRFGRPVDPRTGAPMSRDVPAGAADRAAAILTSLTEGRWEDARHDFDARMRRGADADRLASGWAHMAGMVGRFESMGEPFAHRAGDHTVVEIPLNFEAGTAVGRVIFAEDGRVTGLWLRPGHGSGTVPPWS